MKKQLLFAAMLMLSAAPAVSVSAAQPFAAAALTMEYSPLTL